MEYELDAARDYYYVMRELIAHHAAGTTNERSLATVRKLCRAARVLDDGECAAALTAIEEHAASYFSGGSEAVAARRHLLRELEWFRGRLHALEALATNPGFRPPRPSP
jgi:hypothetical protein